MADVDFSDLKSTEAWFETQSIEMRCAITSRAALRVLAHLGAETREDQILLAFVSFRTNVIFAGRGLGLIAEVKELDWDSAALSAHSARFGIGAGSGAAVSAETIAISAHNAARSAHSAHSTASLFDNDLTRSGAYGFPAYHASISAMEWDAVHDLTTLATTPLWVGAEVLKNSAVLKNIADNHEAFVTFLRSNPAWAFWLRFYDGMWNGTFDEWDLAFEVIKIGEADWEKGYKHIGEVIAGIEAQLAAKAEPKPPTKAQSIAFANRANENTEAIALSVASLLEQLSDYREAVRGDNQSDPQEKQDLLDFLDRLNGSLSRLLALLPTQGEKIEEEGGSALVLWWREYRTLVPKEVAKYTSPANVTTATIPTSMILGGMAIGSLVGGPAGAGVGAIVGGLLTNQVKPGQAADQLTKPYDNGDSGV